MKLAIFGASGRTGRPLVEQALAEGHTVRALVRDRSKLNLTYERLTVIEGDVTDAAKVEETVAGSEAILSVLGPSKTSPKDVLRRASSNISGAAKKHNVRRLITLTGAGVSDPRDKPSAGRAFATTLLKLLVKEVLADSEQSIATYRSSDLDWTIVRAPRLGDGPRTGQYRAGYLNLGMKNKISRADVADFMLKNTQDDTWLRQAPMVSY